VVGVGWMGEGGRLGFLVVGDCVRSCVFGGFLGL